MNVIDNFCSRRGPHLLVALLALAAAPLTAAEMAWNFEPSQTSVHWTLDTALHTVHGTFQLKSGTIRFDPATGSASGALIVNAASGESGSEARDKRMHSSIIESRKYAEIVFSPERVEGAIAPQGVSNVKVHGKFKLMNVDHELTLPVTVDASSGHLVATAKFTVPYIQWGLKNPSLLFLRVNDHVDIDLRAAGSAAH
jgi:polyisoprenoid-binding protein YceI